MAAPCQCLSRRIRVTKCDTAAAVSTPPGTGAISTIRLSGSDVRSILEKCFKPNGRRGFPSAFSAYCGYLVDPSSGAKLDQVVVTTFLEPGSYTGEDLAEISSHGNPVIVQRILSALFAAGARPAEPGEFTRRAFLNGKVDLLDVEAISHLINATSFTAAQIALNQISGLPCNRISGLRAKLIDHLVSIEAGLNFPEDDVEAIDVSRLARDLRTVEESLTVILRSAKAGSQVTQGLNIVLFGKPNTGKSSLMNALLEKPRAIVTSTPGTTRDTIEEPFSIAGVPVRLIDTAGVRDNPEDIESLGIERSLEAIGRAFLVAAVFDGSQPLSNDDLGVISRIESCKAHSLCIFNKADLPLKADINAAKRFRSISVSALTGEGVAALIRAIEELVRAEGMSCIEEMLLLGAGQLDSLSSAIDAVKRATEGVGVTYDDMLAMDLDQAVQQLGRVTGETVEIDMLDRIFEKFCIGK